MRESKAAGLSWTPAPIGSAAGTSQLPPLEHSAVNKGLSMFSDRLWIWLGFCLGFQRQEAVKSLGRMN